MSMYEMVFTDPGRPERCSIILGLLALEGDLDAGRLRDAWIEKDPGTGEPILALYTRNGGGNREDQSAPIESMRAHPLYRRDADDHFDATYASFYFAAPEAYREALGPSAIDPVDTGARWQSAIAGLGGIH